MSSLTEKDIQAAVKKHVNFAMFLALVPIIFMQSVIYFSGEDQLNGSLFFIVPIAVVGACAHFIKSVLIELNVNRVSNT
jgi:hypothetical protein